jgi:hypothetical protein
MMKIKERPPFNMKASTVAPREAMPEIREHPPFNAKTSTGGPWEVVMEIRERPPFNVKTSMANPLGCGARDLGASTIQRENINGIPPRRRS